MADEHPAPTSGVTPYLTIHDGRAVEALEFYKRAFGATEVDRQYGEDGKRLMHAQLIINGASVMFSDDFMGSPRHGGFTLHLLVADADVVWKQAVDAGCEVRMPLADQFWGDRYGQIRDPFGISWSIASPTKK